MKGVADRSVARPAEAAAISSCVLRSAAANPHLIVYHRRGDSRDSQISALVGLQHVAPGGGRHA